MQALLLAVLATASAKVAWPLDAARAEQRMAVFARRCVDLHPARVALRDELPRQQQGMAMLNGSTPEQAGAASGLADSLDDVWVGGDHGTILHFTR